MGDKINRVLIVKETVNEPTEVDPSFCHWFNLDSVDIGLLADEIIKEYNKVQDSSDGSSMFPGELRNLIMRVARTNSEGKLDICDGRCVGYCKCTLPVGYTEAEAQ